MRLDAGIAIPLVILIAAAAVAAWLLSGTWLVGGAGRADVVDSPQAAAAAPQR